MNAYPSSQQLLTYAFVEDVVWVVLLLQLEDPCKVDAEDILGCRGTNT